MPLTTLDPKTALIVLDLQKGIAAYPLLHPIDEVVQRANELSAAFRRKGLPVILVVVDAVPPGRTEQARRQLELPADYADLIPELDQQSADLRVTKKSQGAFANTGLDDKLKAMGVTQVVLLGVATGSAVEATGRQAYELGFNVTFALDAMTDASADNHQHSIARVFPRLGETGSTQEIINLLEATAG